MSTLTISSVMLDLLVPAGTRHEKRRKPLPAHGIALEIGNGYVRVWDYECQSEVDGGWPQMPHIDEVLKALVDQRRRNRGGLVGDFLVAAVSAAETVVAERDGSSVYFAAAGDRIKIGWSRKVGTRIAQLQTGNPEPVKLLATIPGGLSRERDLHRQFAHARLAGEWFTATPDLVEFIDSLVGPNVIPFARRAG